MPLARILTPSELNTDPPADLSIYKWKLIAQGDSWFSMNKYPPSTSLLWRLKFAHATAILNCSYPGDVLTHMVDWRRDIHFYRLFADPRFEEKWDGLLLSAAGNDLIDALQVPPHDSNGVPHLASERLLLTPEERPSQGLIDRYVSQDGWAKFRTHMLEQYRALGTMREGSVKNRNIPIFTHCYAIAQPRDARLGQPGPWLYGSMIAYQIPPSDWLPLSKLFIDRLYDEIVMKTGLENFHVVDSRNMIPPAPAEPKARDRNWANEIHPTGKGYDLIAPDFVRKIESVLPPADQGPVPGTAPARAATHVNGVPVTA